MFIQNNNGQWIRCYTCGGNGVNNGANCWQCNGTGLIWQNNYWPGPPAPPYRPKPWRPTSRPNWVPQCTCGVVSGICPVHLNRIIR